MDDNAVTGELDGAVGVVSFYSKKANSMSSAMLRDATRIVEELSADDSCKVILLKSEGQNFCAGASFEELKSLTTFEEAKEFFSLFGNLTIALKTARQPVVVRVQGKAVGGGVGLIAASDYSIALNGASVRLSEFRVGIGPFVISPVLEWKIGQARTLELSLTADWKDSTWATQAGLFSEICPDESALNLRVKQLITDLSSYPKGAPQLLKGLLIPDHKTLLRQIEKRAELNAKVLLNGNLTI